MTLSGSKNQSILLRIASSNVHMKFSKYNEQFKWESTICKKIKGLDIHFALYTSLQVHFNSLMFSVSSYNKQRHVLKE
jgi:hypothetical protein